MSVKVYNLIITENALKDLKKIDHQDARKIFLWMQSNLSGCSDPKVFGKGLTGNMKGLWRYRVGKYRIISTIIEDIISIEVMTVGHRRSIY